MSRPGGHEPRSSAADAHPAKMPRVSLTRARRQVDASGPQKPLKRLPDSDFCPLLVSFPTAPTCQQANQLQLAAYFQLSTFFLLSIQLIFRFCILHFSESACTICPAGSSSALGPVLLIQTLLVALLRFLSAAVYLVTLLPTLAKQSSAAHLKHTSLQRSDGRRQIRFPVPCKGVYFPLANRPSPCGPRYSSYLPIRRRVSTLDARYQAF